MDRKRKRSVKEIDSAVDGAEEKITTRPPPSEEEVEEFFAILRRVHSSVNKRSGKSSDGNGARAERRTALQLHGELSSTPVLINGGSDGKVSKVVNGAYNGVIDLNAVPEDTAEG